MNIFIYMTIEVYWQIYNLQLICIKLNVYQIKSVMWTFKLKCLSNCELILDEQLLYLFDHGSVLSDL